MNTRQALPLALALVVAGGALAPAFAAPAKPKPITDEYDVRGTPYVLPPTGPACSDPLSEGISRTTRTIKPTGAGTLVVKVTGFAGDWDTSVQNDKGAVLGTGAGTSTGETSGLTADGTEELTLKIKKAQTLNISVCNFAGGPAAHVKYVFTYK
jgi:hypothetical protein